MVGWNQGTIANCVVTVENSGSISGSGSTGGVAGLNIFADAHITNCQVTVNGTIHAVNSAGGVVGFNSDGGTVYDDCTSNYKPYIGGSNTNLAKHPDDEDGQQSAAVIS